MQFHAPVGVDGSAEEPQELPVRGLPRFGGRTGAGLSSAASRVAAPWRRWSRVRHSGSRRRADVARCGNLTWNSSATLTTKAWSGGPRYRPTTSRILGSSSGTVPNLNVSTWPGRMPQRRQTRATLANEMPSSAASSRADHCAAPSRGGGLPSLASVATTTSASSIRGGRPERGSSSSALIPPREYRSRQPITVGRDTPISLAICAFGIPSAASSTIRARFARPEATLGRLARSVSRSRSPSRSTRARAKDTRQLSPGHHRPTSYDTAL